MITQRAKRALSSFLAVVMMFSAVPVQAFADGTNNHVHQEENIVVTSEPTETPSEESTETPSEESTETPSEESTETPSEESTETPSEESTENSVEAPSERAQELTDRINGMLEFYGITADMTDDEIRQVINAKGWAANKPNISEVSEIEALAAEVTESENAYICENADVETFVRFTGIFKPMFAVAMAAASGTHKPVTGVTVGVSGASDNSMSNGKITVTAKGSGGILGFGASAKTATITVYNEIGDTAKISFDWTATSVNQLKIDGKVYSGSSGSFEKTIDAGENFVITITTAKNNTTNKLVMSNFACEIAKAASNVTFQYDNSLGSVTVGGNAVANGAAVEIAKEGIELKATAQNGASFMGWINAETHVIIEKAATFTLQPTEDIAVQAVFVKTSPWFLVNGNALYEGLNAATEAVAAVANKTIVLANNGTLPAGNYTIPSGVTLLIPYDDANTLCTTAPTTTDATTYTAPKVYRKMTMAEGAHITINGAMSLSAVQKASGGQSSPVGNCSFVQMDSGSSITVNNGAKLYAWGYIQGAGEVTVENGGTVYECFQVMDWRGGDNTSDMVDNKQRVFPMSQYYIQNIEVPMTLKSGAIEKGYMSVSITLVGVQGAAVPFIGSDGMFQIKSGYIVKDYDESTGRLEINVHGDLSVQSLSISMKLALIGSKTINSSKYVLPINGNMTINMHSGAVTMTQDVALLPGAKLIVGENATCTLGNGNNIYVYDYDQWVTETAENLGSSFCGTGEATHINLKYPDSATKVQGRTDDAYVEINGTVDTSAGYVYTTASGANVCGTGTIIMKPGQADAKTYQSKCAGSDGKDVRYYEIAITSAKLKNANGTYVETANDLGKVTYKSVNGMWTCEHTYAEGTCIEEVTATATCQAAGSKTFTCNCGEASKTEAIAQLEHEYDSVVTEPTCTEGGFTKHTCKNGCGNTYNDSETASLGHDEVNHEAQAPTCVEAGWNAYVTCSRCDYTTYVEVPALNHDEVPHEAKAPTCTEIGWDAYVTCSRCGYSTYEEKAALDHDRVDHEAKAPTCTEVGWDAYVTCSRCDYTTYVEKGVVDHTWAWVTDKEATVLNPGIKHEECSVCHTKQNENTEIPVLVCSHAGTMSATEAKAATCTEEGYSAYWYCSACQNYYNDAAGQHEIAEGSWVIAALGHDEVPHEAKAPTCTEIGWDAYVTCSRCYYNTYAPKAALTHDEITHDAKAPTCSEVGWEAYVTCSRCDYTTKGEDLPINPENHVWDEGTPIGIHSCNDSSYMVYKCTQCGTENKVVVREQHFRVPIAEEIPATCTEDGMSSGWKCEKCDEFWIPQEVIPALGHDWNGKLPCQAETSACTRCDVHFDSKQEHLIIVDEGTSATCTEAGLSEGSHCGYCGEILVAQVEIPAIDHNWIETATEIAATCGMPGHKAGARYCLDCDYDADPIPALEHEWMHREAKKATYSAIGWNAHDYCLMCKTIKTVEQYKSYPCEFCGENPEGYIEIPKVEVQKIETADEFLRNIGYLEMIAEQYAKEHPGTDPLALVLNYMRTAVDNYTSGSWAIMAGPEDLNFLKYVQEKEDGINSAPEIDVWVNVSGLKKLGTFRLENETNHYNKNKVMYLSGHFFGTMDMTYHNKDSQNHADVGGWVGDLVDLLSTTDEYGVDADLTLEEKIAYITQKYLFQENVAGAAGSFGSTDLYADLDAYYFMNELLTKGYKTGDLESMMREYYQSGLTLKERVSYLLTNRLDALSTRKDLRTAVYNAYTSNKLIATLEGTRNFTASGNELTELRKAVCYAFADEMCRLAGDYVEDLTNPRFTVFDSETKILAPGISQQINYATNADGKQIVYYVATADVARDDVGMWVNYYDRDPGTPENPQWKNNTVLSSAQNAQDRYGDPASEDYIPNFNVVASTNAGGYSMSGDATPGGLFVMNGIEWYPQKGSAGFFAILDDGTAYMGTAAEYETMKDRIQEAIGGFGEFVVQDGKVTGSAAASDAPRTSVGITSTGRVVIMCIDGRQAPFSSGASLQDVGYIMKEAGCVVAINLDGGGSTTFVARQPGSDDLTIMNSPSDGYPRNVSSNLLLYSTAPSSTAFDHAVIESQYDYATINTPVQMTAAGVSPSGNAVEIPEGAVWAVSDESWASITEDGVFTGKRLGEVSVYLMLDGEIIGSKLMTMDTPDQLYFEKNKVDAIYGSSVQLPLCARIEGKSIAINPDDVTITLSAPAAGTMDGFIFNAAETDIKTLTITAAVDENIKASINVMLYKQGENSFDFDKATGGDRMLAWDRQVSNAKAENGNIYNVIDSTKDMVTSYTFALDMTAIPIPERLEELTYMLPGGTMEGANAWSFLLSLAQRISDLTWVQATVDFDDRFDVDYSNLKVLNDYFELKDTKFDETTNTLTVTLNWLKQSRVIDEATANPLCLINGIKLTPKDGVWNDVSKINVVTAGTIGYEIYMRASGLYSFANKPENQAVFGIYPYRNPADTTDAGGYFKDTYAQITDEYTLVNVVKEGWVNEEGGFAYYVDGERLTGVQEVEGFYYDFGEKGVNVGQTKFTGLFQIDNFNYYAKNGELAKGWYSIADDWYLFDWQTGKAVDGQYNTTIEKVKVTYQFENGKLVKGYWHETDNGLQYFYGPYLYKQGLVEIEGEQYIFEEYYACTGIRPVKLAHASTAVWYEFTDKGAIVGYAKDGLHWYEGKLYYVVDGTSVHTGFYKIDGHYYYFQSNNQAIVGKTNWVSNTNGLLPAGAYRFNENGQVIMVDEVVNEDGTLYYYRDGMRANNAGLIEFNGDYYRVGSGGVIVINEVSWIGASNSLGFPAGYYLFGEDGKLNTYTGIRTEGDTMYYYRDGMRVNKANLIEFEGAIYHVGEMAVVTTNKTVWISTNASNGLVKQDNYDFGPDGKMIIYHGVHNGYYYVNGIKTAAGLVMQDGSYYFAAGGGKLKMNEISWISNNNGLMPAGTYRFDEQGRIIMDTEVVNENGVLYYYANGMRKDNAGLIKYNGDYYRVGSGGVVVTNEASWIGASNAYGFTAGYYLFGEDGKLSTYTGIRTEGDTMYYYRNGMRINKANLIEFEGAIYHVGDLAVVTTNKTVWISTNASNGLVKQDNYDFGPDGKMIIYHGVANGYYYVNGIKTAAGLVMQDGSYYFAAGGGKLKMNEISWISNNNGLLPAGTYRFDEQGRIIMDTEVVNENGVLYYYANGMRKDNAGLIKYNGDYYRVGSGGLVVTNEASWIGASNVYGFTAGYYLFGEDGKLSTYTGIRTEGDTMYYYRNGMRINKANLIEFEGAIYHVGDLAVVTTNKTVWISTNASNGLVKQDNYDFGPDGKMIIYHGVANGYYYVNGIKTAAGLVMQDGSYYFAAGGGKLKMNEVSWISNNNGLLPAGTYRFDEQGRIIMDTEVVNENGVLYYYVNGMRKDNAGLIEFNGNYYRVGSGGLVATNVASWIGASNAYGFTAGYYLFGEDGKLSTYTGIRTEGDTMYYYRNGMRINKANLIEFEGAIYHVGDLAVVTTNKTVWISTNASNGLVKQGNYTFGSDGKMIVS